MPAMTRSAARFILVNRRDYPADVVAAARRDLAYYAKQLLATPPTEQEGH